MNGKEHDRLAWRLAQILIRLNDGEILDLDALAEEFGVHRRTLQRDLHQRFAFLPLEWEQGRCQIDPAYLGRLRPRDIERFAALAGIRGLFPSLDVGFVRELFDARLQDTLAIHGPAFERLSPEHVQTFRTLQEAIRRHCRVRITYCKPESSRSVDLEPYRLMHHDGVWYLAASEDGKPKAWSLTRIGMLRVLEDEGFEPDPAIASMLDEEDSIWINQKKVEVILTVAAPVAPYFRRRQLLPRQHIVRDLEGGGLIVAGRFAHPNQLLPMVRYWLPHVRIVSPEEWQREMERELRDFLAE